MAPLARVGLAWSATALVVLTGLAGVERIPQGSEGRLVSGTLEVSLQAGLLVATALGVVLAVRWPAAGGAVIVLAATGIGVLLAFEYEPLAALVPFLALFVPGALLLVHGLRGRPLRAALAIAGLMVVLTGAGVAAHRVSDDVFGPTHPESAVRLPSGPVEWIWSGAPGPTGARVTARLRDARADARLVVGDDATLTSGLRRIAASAEGGDGAVRAFAVDSLRPGRSYHYALEVDGRLDRTRVGRLRTVPDGAASFTVAFGGCARSGSNGAVFDAIRREDPDLYLILGDMFYADIAEDDPDRFRDALDQALTRPAQQALYLRSRIAYVWDDHDYGPNDAGADSPSRDAAQTVYREYVPHGALPGGARTGPVYQAFTLGRARFLVMDLRSVRSPADAPDGPAKSMLGRAQRRWLEAEMLQARRRRQLVVLVSSVPWISSARPGADDWGGYAHERARLSRFVADNRVRAVMLAGDAHMVALDDGSHSDYSGTGRAGFPVIHGLALDRRGTVKGGPYSAGAIPGGGHFGTITVRDDGRRLRVALRGMDWRGRRLLGGDFTFTP